jgi:hypothetical protein
MKLSGIPFGTTDWSSVERTEHRGERFDRGANDVVVGILLGERNA